ncbi:MAG: hypothetical protein RJA31_1087, partial [Actinomycetota bacterium]
PMVRSGEADAVWCGQGMIPERIALVDFTQPYAIFNETVLVRAGDPASGPHNMAGYRVGAIAGSANLKVARTIDGAEIVEFGASADVFGDMIEALRSGEVDAFVDDDVVTVPLGDEPESSPETRNCSTNSTRRSTPSARTVDFVPCGKSGCLVCLSRWTPRDSHAVGFPGDANEQRLYARRRADRRRCRVAQYPRHDR